MAGKVATLPSGSRITDFVSFGILARAFPIAKVHEALAATGKASQRQRDLPAHVVVYYERLTRKLKAVREEAWRLMHAPLAIQHDWYAAVLRGHYGYYGRPHNYPALNGFYREIRRIWLRCLRRRSQKSRRMGWDEFETLTERFPLPVPRITRSWAQARI